MVFMIGDSKSFKSRVGSGVPVWEGPWTPVNPADEDSYELHAVLIVGISDGSISCQKPHFIIQNSWGSAEPSEVSSISCQRSSPTQMAISPHTLHNAGCFLCPSGRAAPLRQDLWCKCRPHQAGLCLWFKALCRRTAHNLRMEHIRRS